MGRYEIYRDASRGKQSWRWRYVSANGKTIFETSESYGQRNAALHALDIAKQSADAPLYVMPDGPCRYTKAVRCDTVAEAKSLAPARRGRPRMVGS